MVETREVFDNREVKVETNPEQAEIYSGTADKNNDLKQLAIGGLIGAVMGTVAIVLTDKKAANSVNQTAKDLGNAVKGATKGINNTIKNGVEKVKEKTHSTGSDQNSQPTVENEINFSSAVNSDVLSETVENSGSSAATRTIDEQVINLYEERLTASKKHVKTGEVAIAKQVETHLAQISVPLKKERLIIEKIPVDNESSVALGEANFVEGRLVNIELYEQVAEIEKQAFVREQVRVRKQVEYTAVEIEDQIRREQLDFDIQNKNGDDTNVKIADQISQPTLESPDLNS